MISYIKLRLMKNLIRKRNNYFKNILNYMKGKDHEFIFLTQIFISLVSS